MGNWENWGLVATPGWRTIVHSSSREALGERQQRIVLLCLITPGCPLGGRKAEGPPMPFYYFGRREATSAGMIVEAAFRVIFRD